MRHRSPRPRAIGADVAAAAGVSQSAVSRTFRKGGSVAPDTRARVIAAAEALGYRPNAMARAVTHAALGRGRDRDARRHGGLLSRGAGPCRADAEQSTQAAFGRMLFELARSDHPLADRIVTTSPDVTVSTNLGAWLNRRGLFRRKDVADVFAAARIPSAQKWSGGGAGQHIELGIAEHNLFLMLAAAGLAGPLFGTRLLPIGTVYDPFIARGLDALNYAAYMDARFLLVATPSGVTLGPEGGAHQSIATPLIGMGQPGLASYEPAFADELAVLLEDAFARMQAADGGSTYLRLTTRAIAQRADRRPLARWHARRRLLAAAPRARRRGTTA